MRSVSSIYKMLRALIDDGRMGTGRFDTRIRVEGNTYGRDTLISTKLYSSLTGDGNGIVVGQACSSECEIILLEDSANWERMQKFYLEVRVTVGSTSSGWVTIGTFYTDTRTEDEYGRLQIVAYDGMLLTEQSWTDKIPEELLPASYPITARAWATMIQGAGLATFADLTQLDDTVAFVGLDTTTTIRDVLKTIAAAHAGNWIVTPSETLKLIQFTNLDIQTASASQYINLNTSVENLTLSPALSPVTRVELESEDGVVASYGSDTGYTLKSACNFSTTTGVAELCLNRISQYVYRPFTATNSILDPAAEIGDQVAIDGVMYQIMSINWTFSDYPYAEVSAPYDQEIDHEYTIVSQEAKNYRKTMGKVDEKLEDYVAWEEFSTAIIQNEASINLVASHTFVTQNDFNTEIAAIQNQLDGNIQSWSGNVVPTLNNAPAVDWTTPTAKAEHVGDMYFINSDAGIPEAGQYYRFEENNGVYSWQLITDSAITEALAQAAAALAAAETAQDSADAANTEAQLRGRVFVVQPTPPYSVGDLWFNDDQSVIKVCTTARETGSFVGTDWEKRDKYTDDSAFEAFQTAYQETITAIQEQLDQKAETYYQSEDPSVGWVIHPVGIAIAGIDVVGIPNDVALAHTGDLWYRTTDGTTWFWNGSAWEPQDIPDEVFDKIDGKAQIFISTPYTPYNVGDLWFNSANSDIMTCVTKRETGDFVQSDWQKRNKYTDDSALISFVNATYTPAIAAIQESLDGKVDTYFYSYEPTLSNAPASQWTTTALKDSHVDDLFYNTSNGYTYRFTKSGSTYSWTRIKDADIVSAMQAASTAQDTADGKRRVFVAQPTNAQAYDVGDLWVNATYGSTYSNDLLRCSTAKAAGASFNINHWAKATKYTDDSSFTTFVNTVYTPEIAAIQSELDGKVDTYFYAYAPTLQNVPASQWTTNALKDEHIDDLFFDTVSGYTYRFAKSGSTYSWQRVKDSDITSAMTAASSAQDTADGKRRVFVAQPTNAQAYDVGDLWVNATYGSTYSNDLLRCKTAKAAGSTFNISHWEKASKYTDDTAANAVGQQLTQFESSFSVEPSQISAEIAKNVVKDKQSTKTTFGWLMSDTSHTWYANNSEVMKIQQSGLSVTGSITATSGYIGNGSNGFSIDPTNIHNGMTSLADTTHNGVYVGTDGIALGMGKFKVTSAGAVTASDLAITGGSIKLGGTSSNPVFQVTNAGAVTASNMSILGGSITIRDTSNNVIFQANSSGVTVNGNGTFTGTVYAANIQVGGAAGYITGNQIGSGEVDTSNLAISAVTNDILSSNSVSTSKLQLQAVDSGNVVANCLTDAQMAINSLTTDALSLGIGESLSLADLFGLAITSGTSTYPQNFTAGRLDAFVGMYSGAYNVREQGEVVYDLTSHYHSFTERDGKVYMGAPTGDSSHANFNIADTQAYKDGVAAIEVKSLDMTYTYDSSMHIYRLNAAAKNQAGTTVYQTTDGQWNTDRSAYVDGKADGADEVTVDTVTQYSYSSTGDKSVSIENGYLRYNNGQLVGRVNISLNGNSNTATCVVSMDGQRAVDDSKPRAIVRRTNQATGTAMPDTWNSTTNTGYVYLRATTNNNSIYVDQNIEVDTNSAIYQAGVTAGQGSGADSVTVQTLGFDPNDAYWYSSSVNNYYIPIKATLSTGLNPRTATLTISGQEAYTAGANSVTATVSMSGATIPAATDQATITATASLSGGGSASNTYSIYMETVTNTSSAVTMQVAHGSGSSKVVLAQKSVTPAHEPETATVTMSGAVVPAATDQAIITATANLSGGGTATNTYGIYIQTALNTENSVTMQIAHGSGSSLVILAQKSVAPVHPSVTVRTVGSVAATASNYNTYDKAIAPSSASLYTAGGYSYGLAKITLSNDDESILQFRVPSITNLTATRLYTPDRGWAFEGNNVFVRTSLQALNGNTVIYPPSGTTIEALVDVSDIVEFFAADSYDHASALDTDGNNYGTYDTSLNLGLTGKSYVSGTQRYGRVGIYNGDGSLIRTIRVYMPAGSSGTATVSRGQYPYGTYYNDYGYAIHYYKWTGSAGYVAVNITQDGTTTGPYDIDVTYLVQACMAIGGGSSSPRTVTRAYYETDEYGVRTGKIWVRFSDGTSQTNITIT